MAKLKRYSEPASERDWQAQYDCETLMRAEEIKADKKRLAAAQKYANEKLKQIARVASEED